MGSVPSSAVSAMRAHHIRSQAYLAAAACTGQHDQARECLSRLSKHRDLTGDDLYFMARAYAALGDENLTTEYLERAEDAPGGPTRKEIEVDPLIQLRPR